MDTKDTLKGIEELEITVENWQRRLDIIKTNITGQEAVRDELRIDVEEARKVLADTQRQCGEERNNVLKLQQETMLKIKESQDALQKDSASMGDEKVNIAKDREQIGHIREDSLALKNKLTLVSKKIDEINQIMNK